MPRFQGENFERNVSLIGKVEELARAKKCTPAATGARLGSIQG